jgi:hypothetical protein
MHDQPDDQTGVNTQITLEIPAEIVSVIRSGVVLEWARCGRGVYDAVDKPAADALAIQTAREKLQAADQTVQQAGVADDEKRDAKGLVLTGPLWLLGGVIESEIDMASSDFGEISNREKRTAMKKLGLLLDLEDQLGRQFDEVTA